MIPVLLLDAVIEKLYIYTPKTMQKMALIETGRSPQRHLLAALSVGWERTLLSTPRKALSESMH